MTKNPCERKCWTCGNVAMHADDVAPDVCCAKCGSQDTRRTKPIAAVQAMADRDEHAEVGSLLARCEEYSVVPYWDKAGKGWLANVRVRGPHSNRVCIEKGKTQLEAIRAAVEAAEQGGVRE